MTDKEKAKNWKTFEDWKFVMNDALVEFFNKLPEELRDNLDFSVLSLNLLEQFILDNFTQDSLKEENNMYWLDGFARYIGEIFKRSLNNATWSINLKDEDEVYYGLPLITTEKGIN
jgi:hypothetical protein